MTNTLAEAIAFIKARGPFYLDGQCEKLVNNAGAFTHTYGLAILAMQASPVKMNPNYAAAPAGVIHYWTNVWGNWPGYGYCDAGHTMIGDGAGLLWGDSGAITTHYGLYAGSVTKADLEARKPWLRYAGWTPYHGPETLAGLTFASDGSTVLSNITPQEEDTMIEAVHYTNEPGKSVAALVDAFMFEIVADETAALYCAPGTKPREVAADFLTFHPQQVARNLAAVAAAVVAAQSAPVAAVSLTDAQLAAIAAQVAKLIVIPPFPAVPTAADIAAATVKAEGSALSNG